MNANYALIILINYIPFFFLICGVVTVLMFSDFFTGALFAIAWLFLLPPLMSRFFLLILGRPTRSTKVGSREFFAWWISVQWQNIFARFPALEEGLRMIPGVYSMWLRLWGARVGKCVYWTAGSKVLDRPFLKVGNFVIVGYGAKITSHLFHMKSNNSYFLFGEPEIGDYAVLGGDCGVGPGAKIPSKFTVAAGEYVSPLKRVLKEKANEVIQEVRA